MKGLAKWGGVRPLLVDGLTASGLTAEERAAFERERVMAPKRCPPQVAPTLEEWVAMCVQHRAAKAAHEAIPVRRWKDGRWVVEDR